MRQSILVVDDLHGVRESIRIALTEAGCRVDVAENGRRALEMLAAGAYDVAVTDIWMPEVDGLSLIKRVREEQPGLRIFAMTGGGPRMTMETATSLAEVWGAERVFIKPFDERELVAAIVQPAPQG